MKNQVLENPVKNQNESFTSLTVISCLMVTFYLIANIMAVKVISIGGIALFDAGTVTFPFAYMLGDALTEVWGFRTAKKVIFVTFLCNIILVAATSLGLILPAPDYMAETTAAYAGVFTYVPRIVAASLLAFLGGELSNAWVMEAIKKRTGKKYLWIRTIGSSAVGYIFDTVIFVLVAFWGTSPVRDLLTMIVAQYFMKLGLEAIGGTPLAYGLIAWLKRHENTAETESGGGENG